jgi:hypothetical protein
MSLKSVIKSLTPPIIWRQLSYLAHRHEEHPDYLFDNQARLFKQSVRDAVGYMEYGVGKSTVWVQKNSSAKIFGVDSNKKWVDYVLQQCGGDERLRLMSVDLGEVGDWGRPLTLNRRAHIINYTLGFWGSVEPAEIDVVLIDGRFRISCFYASLAHAKPGCKVFFDDYVMRPIYHEVENDLNPTAVEGRQALFNVPRYSDSERVTFLEKSKEFSLVFD